MKSRFLLVFSVVLVCISNIGLSTAYADSTFVHNPVIINTNPCVTFDYAFDIHIASGDSIVNVNRDLTDLNTGQTVSSFKAVNQSGPFDGTFTTITHPAVPPGTAMGDMLRLTLSWAGLTPGSISIDAPCSNNAVCPMFFDGRLNDCDPGETFAAYCNADNSLTVLAIFKGKGYHAFTISPTRIAKVSKTPKKNTLITQRLGARLYRLTSGFLQINRAEDGTGKEYKFTFTDCNVPQPLLPGQTPPPPPTND